MKISRYLFILFVVSFVFLSVHSGHAQIPKKGGTLIIGTPKDPHGLDPHKMGGVEGVNIFPQILDGLLNIDDEGKVVPGLAVSLPERLDPVTYTFTLRKGVKFHNGADFDAQDVKFSFDRLIQKEISQYWKRTREMVKSVEILDPYKVKITLLRPDITFMDMLGKNHEFQILPRGTGANITRLIGTGPFKFKEWIKDDHLTLVRNENYWREGLPYLDQIIYKPYPETSTRVINLKTGKVDLGHELPAKDGVELKKDPRFKVMSRSGGQLEQFWFNTTKPPFHDKRVRQAIAYGIDRRAVAESVFMGFAEVAQDLFPSWHWAYNPNLKLSPYNPEKAKALLKEAGYSDGAPLSFTLSCTNEPTFVDQAVIIQAQLAKIGVKVEVLPQEKSFWLDSMLARKGRDFVASLEDHSDDMTELHWVYRFYSSKSNSNFPGYNRERYGKKGAQNPEVEHLLENLFGTSNQDKRKKMYDEIRKMVYEDVPVIYLSFYQNVVGMWGHVKNHKVLTRNNIPLKEVWVEK